MVLEFSSHFSQTFELGHSHATEKEKFKTILLAGFHHLPSLVNLIMSCHCKGRPFIEI